MLHLIPNKTMRYGLYTLATIGIAVVGLGVALVLTTSLFIGIAAILIGAVTAISCAGVSRSILKNKEVVIMNDRAALVPPRNGLAILVKAGNSARKTGKGVGNVFGLRSKNYAQPRQSAISFFRRLFYTSSATDEARREPKSSKIKSK